MGNQSFTDIEATTDETATPGEGYSPVAGTSSATSSAITHSPGSSSPATQHGGLSLEGTGIEGEVDRRDIHIPKLTLVNSLSKTRTEGELPLGALVFSDTIVLNPVPNGPDGKPARGYKETPQIEVVVLGLKKSYQKKTEYGSDEETVRCDTAAEVRALGGTIERNDKTRPLFEETAQILISVPAPVGCDENDLDYFLHETAEGKRYAKALFFVKSIAYTNVAKEIFTFVNNTRQPTINTTFLLWSKFMSTEKFSWWTPKLKAGRRTTPEERAFFASKQ